MFNYTQISLVHTELKFLYLFHRRLYAKNFSINTRIEKKENRIFGESFRSKTEIFSNNLFQSEKLYGKIQFFFTSHRFNCLFLPFIISSCLSHIFFVIFLYLRLQLLRSKNPRNYAISKTQYLPMTVNVLR